MGERVNHERVEKVLVEAGQDRLSDLPDAAAVTAHVALIAVTAVLDVVARGGRFPFGISIARILSLV